MPQSVWVSMCSSENFMQRPDAQADSDGKVARIQVFAFAPAVTEDLPMPCLQLKTGESMPEADILQSLSDSDVAAVYFEKFSDG